ncbi:hypothetical protein DRJ04_04185 [Candidatus Aerophobetes bacterium]|uniref:Uncharacterized protein n=1 Tax=Aerophobetes bacterium TaxID=2030807 RepID=A0A662DHC6_UNCAE|nr:MAG: hypothetical protein DRJ04_04185 [Candidatus Aerophobetes bacterium]
MSKECQIIWLESSENKVLYKFLWLLMVKVNSLDHMGLKLFAIAIKAGNPSTRASIIRQGRTNKYP